MIGYLSKLDCQPGDTVDVMISSDTSEITVDLVRLINGDDRPGAPGLIYEVIDDFNNQVITPELHDTPLGSYAISHSLVEFDKEFIFECWIYPTLLKQINKQGIVNLPDMGLSLIVNELDEIALLFGEEILIKSREIDDHKWHHLCVKLSSNEISLSYTTDEGVESVTSDHGVDFKGKSRVVIAAAEIHYDNTRYFPSGVFNGKISNPLFRVNSTVIAGWNFSSDIKTQEVSAMKESLSQDKLHLINAPQRAVTGPTWQGQCYDWTQTPEQYNAIHFHNDDLSDACWPTSAPLKMPSGLESGVYAVRLRAEGLRDDLIPLIITPAEKAIKKPILLVLPTFTYIAYANERLTEGEYNKTSKLPLNRGNCEDLLEKHPEWGKSVYDKHNDGSGVAYSSSLRPIPNYRPDYQFWGFSGPRRFPIDLYIVWFLTEKGYSFDVISEHYLHKNGSQAFQGYKAVLSGCQPEYCSETMLNAWKDYYESGGNIMYLGGDGFYWVTTSFADAPHVLEVRKSEGFRHWECEPGERYHASTGELGGLWRTRGRSSHKLFGVGIGGAGWDEVTPGFTRSDDSYEEKYAWIFKGITERVIGDFGLLMNGTSGDEIDRIDYKLGTPKSTVILASATGHSEWFSTIPEDIMKVSNRLNAKFNHNVRSDMVIIGEPGKGCVFSVGSITFCGALPVNDGRNNIATLIGNILNGFIKE